MYPLLFLAIVVVALAFVLDAIKDRGSATPTQSDKMPYKVRTDVFNRSEAAFFLELQKQLPQGFYIFPKMRIIDFIDPNSDRYTWRNQIWSKHIDFLICDQHFKPVVAIEVNGSSHQRSDRVRRDEHVSKILTDAGLQLVWVNVGTDFTKAATTACSLL